MSLKWPGKHLDRFSLEGRAHSNFENCFNKASSSLSFSSELSPRTCLSPIVHNIYSAQVQSIAVQDLTAITLLSVAPPHWHQHLIQKSDSLIPITQELLANSKGLYAACSNHTKGDLFNHFTYMTKIATSSKGNPDVPPNAISL